MAQNSGWRKIPALGSQNHNTQWEITRKLYGRFQIPLYWSVQAIDTGFMGSPFAPEIAIPIQYPELLSDDELPPGGTLAWETQADYLDSISGYWVQIDDDPAFGSLAVDDVVSMSRGFSLTPALSRGAMHYP